MTFTGFTIAMVVLIIILLPAAIFDDKDWRK